MASRTWVDQALIAPRSAVSDTKSTASAKAPDSDDDLGPPMVPYNERAEETLDLVSSTNDLKSDTKTDAAAAAAAAAPFQFSNMGPSSPLAAPRARSLFTASLLNLDGSKSDDDGDGDSNGDPPTPTSVLPTVQRGRQRKASAAVDSKSARKRTKGGELEGSSEADEGKANHLSLKERNPAEVRLQAWAMSAAGAASTATHPAFSTGRVKASGQAMRLKPDGSNIESCKHLYLGELLLSAISMVHGQFAQTAVLQDITLQTAIFNTKNGAETNSTRNFLAAVTEVVTLKAAESSHRRSNKQAVNSTIRVNQIMHNISNACYEHYH